MPAFVGPWEMETISAIVEDLKTAYDMIDKDHLIEIVALEARNHGIHPEVSMPIARDLI